MKELQKRLIKGLKIEIRNDEHKDSNEKIIEGILPYNSPSEKMYLGYSEADREIITPTAWKKTLADNRNIFLNYNHNSDLILASTKSGTMTVNNEDDGLHFKASLPDTDIGNRCYQTIKRGDVNTLSFEFYPVQYETRDNISYITSGRLEAISVCVANPAYAATDCQARNLVQKLAEIKETISTKEIEEMDKEDIKELKELLTAILEKLPNEEVEDKQEEPIEELPSEESKREAEPEEEKEEDTSGQPEDIQTEETEISENEEAEDSDIQKLCEELIALKKELEDLQKENN